MIFSEERQSHLAHIITDGIWKDDLVDFEDDGLILRLAKKAISDWIAGEDTLDQTVRKKIETLKRNVQEGSPEWDIMYSKYYEEELSRRG